LASAQISGSRLGRALWCGAVDYGAVSRLALRRSLGWRHHRSGASPLRLTADRHLLAAVSSGCWPRCTPGGLFV